MFLISNGLEEPVATRMSEAVSHAEQRMSQPFPNPASRLTLSVICSLLHTEFYDYRHHPTGEILDYLNEFPEYHELKSEFTDTFRGDGHAAAARKADSAINHAIRYLKGEERDFKEGKVRYEFPGPQPRGRR